MLSLNLYKLWFLRSQFLYERYTEWVILSARWSFLYQFKLSRDYWFLDSRLNPYVFLCKTPYIFCDSLVVLLKQNSIYHKTVNDLTNYKFEILSSDYDFFWNVILQLPGEGQWFVFHNNLFKLYENDFFKWDNRDHLIRCCEIEISNVSMQVISIPTQW